MPTCSACVACNVVPRNADAFSPYSDSSAPHYQLHPLPVEQVTRSSSEEALGPTQRVTYSEHRKAR